MIEHRFAACVLVLAALAGVGEAQAPRTDTSAWPTVDDHRNMLQQLGILILRPGRAADASAPNAANYDEALANPYPNLPDALTQRSGAKVTTPEQWWNERRPEIVDDFEREVVGRVPAGVPSVTWSVAATREWEIGGERVVGRQLVGTVDNSAYPAIEVEICMTLVTPADASAVPVMIMFGGGTLPPEAIAPEALRTRAGPLRGPAVRPARRKALAPRAPTRRQRSSSSPPAGGSSPCARRACRPTTARDSRAASSVSSTKASRASPTIGARYALGPGVPRAR